MGMVTVDFETYYDKDYSLSKIPVEDYVTDERFQIMLCGLKKDDAPAIWLSSPRIEDYAEWFYENGVDQSALLCHNTMFDGLILQHHFGIVPPLYLDTLALAQALLKPFHRSISLDSCLKVLTHLGINKGTTVHDMKGRRLESLSRSELQKYADYCKIDCEGEYYIFQDLKKRVPREELIIIDLILRMYLEPLFELDRDTLQHVYQDTVDHKRELMAKLPEAMQPGWLMSNQKLARLLEKLGVDIPMKISPTTEQATYAFSKNDPGWKDLEEEYEDDPLVGPILAARVGVKSTLAETRALRLVEIADRHKKLRVPLRYYAAHTGRLGGHQKINIQNLTRVNQKLGHRRQLRYGLRAPKGYKVLAADLSQIEARLNAWLSDCKELLEVFRTGGDPYAVFASKVFRRTIVKNRDDKERFIGKTCILGLGYGMGWKKLRATLRKDNIKVEEAEAHLYTNVYRNSYFQIPALWKFCDETIEIIATGGKRYLGPCLAQHGQILLPNGMAIEYPNLRKVHTPKYEGWYYTFAGQGRTLWGGKVDENVVQALARIIIMYNMVRIRRESGFRPVLQAHDELVYIVPDSEVQGMMDFLLAVMKTPPDFAPDLPLDAEVAFGDTYGDAK